MKRWLRRKIKNWLDDSIEISCDPIAIRSNNDVNVEGIAFTVMPANGGVIVQTRNYDHKTDRHNYNTYIIHEDESVPGRIGQIVSLELLKH